jgi:hypothetical protein
MCCKPLSIRALRGAKDGGYRNPKITVAASAVAASQGYWRGVGRRLMRDPGGVIVGVIIFVLLVLALFGPWLIVKDPYQTSMFMRLKPIGTDGFPWVPMSWGATCSPVLSSERGYRCLWALCQWCLRFLLAVRLALSRAIWGQNQHPDYAHHRHFRLSLGTAGHCPFRRDGRRH